ncbi:hypothetical protein KSS87_022965, partial [Heliosperma pusillum]
RKKCLLRNEDDDDNDELMTRFLPFDVKSGHLLAVTEFPWSVLYNSKYIWRCQGNISSALGFKENDLQPLQELHKGVAGGFSMEVGDVLPAELEVKLSTKRDDICTPRKKGDTTELTHSFHSSTVIATEQE